MTDPVPSKDLLPCPFCGKAAKVYGVNLVGCVDTVSCGAQIDWGHFYGPDPVIAAWNKRAAPEGIDRLQRDNARLETLLRLAEGMREPEPYYAALNRLTVAMGNPALSWKDGETIESALIDEATRRLSAPEPRALPDLDSQEFYEVMQAYRHAPVFDQAFVVKPFEAVKAFLRATQPPRDGQ